MIDTEDFTVKAGGKFDLADIDPKYTGAYKAAEDVQREMESNVEKIGDLQEKLYAESRRALLLILQGMDTSGKDAITRAVMDSVDPQGCVVTAFKRPSANDLAHDYLWRVHKEVPPRGMIGIFNRSHYEDVFIVRVHDLVPEKVWRTRYRQINAFERHLVENDVTVLKFLLHISADEQKRRLQSRLDDKKKHWKFNPDDLKERALWKDYMKAYEVALTECNTEWAPWYVIPSDKKWFRNFVAASIVRETLEEMDPEFPKVTWDPRTIRIE